MNPTGQSPPPKSEPKLIDAIIEAAKKAFTPGADEASKTAGLREYHDVIDRSPTWHLLMTLNALIKPNVLPSWLKESLMQTLTCLPLRPDGVRGTMEFVFSVHPSSSNDKSSAGQAQKQGASITHEAVAISAKLLSSVPSSMTPETWFTGIAGQLFDMLDGTAGKDLQKAAAQIVGYGILGKKQFGAPGSAGWSVFVQPLLENVNPSLRQPRLDHTAKKEPVDDVLDLTQDQILVTSQALTTSLQRLSTLVLSTPSPGLCRRVLQLIILQIWALASWADPPEKADKSICQVAQGLLKTYLRLFGKIDSIMPLVKNMLCNGSLEGGEPSWRFQLTAQDELASVANSFMGRQDDATALGWNDVDGKATMLADTLLSVCSSEETSQVFLQLLKQWIQLTSPSKELKIKIEMEEQPLQHSPVQELAALTLLQKMMDKAPEKLISQFDQLIELICQVLKADRQSSLGDEVVAVVLSLLNLVVTAPTFQKKDLKPDDLRAIEESLDELGNQERPDVSLTARNLAMVLQFRDDMEQTEDTVAAATPRQIEDRRTYNLAMGYITGAGNPPPVMSEGISLLSNLIVAESPILDIPAINVLMSSLLSDGEDYINLRVIKTFTQLANKHPRSTVKELLDHYLDPQEKSTTDIRLRFGEALAQVIERLGDTFYGEVAKQTGEVLLSIAGRRGYRPKTMAKQAREERLRKLKEKKKQAVPEEEEEEDPEEDVDVAEKANEDMIAQIVQGWESKRGAEDIRMRTSALSIFGSAMEVNIAGIGPTLVSTAVDLCVNILTMETDLETGILRRAAIVVVLGFVRALDKARTTGRSLGFGLTDSSREDILRTLQYVRATDNDGLVKEHAAAVVESIENWQLSTLLSQADSNSSGVPGLSRLAGLCVNPGGIDLAGRPRPRIEEIE